ncbi:hypothetical protein BDW72DRAFT_186962 [Aspergillus terricola var. indicus]
MFSKQTMDDSMNERFRDAVLRLEAAVPAIKSAMEITNSPSVSLGVMHEGKVIFRKSIGLGDVEGNLEATSDTSYFIGSCSKMLTATALGILVEEKKLTWNDPIRKHLPSFNPIEDPRIGEEATIIDACRHTTGLANILFQGPNGALVHRAEDHIAMVNALPTSSEDGQRFRECWNYSSGAFGLLALIVEAVTGMSYSKFLQQRILQPLGLKQTLVSEADVTKNENLAHPYVRMADGKWSKITNRTTTEHHSPVLASVGIRSSVNDLLYFFAAVMDQFHLENNGEHSQRSLDEGVQNPLRQISSMWNNWWTYPVDDGFENDTAYTLGWYRTTIPTGALGLISYNSFHDEGDDAWLEQIIGRESDPHTLYGHNGITNGSLATAYCFPMSQTAIVVLGNAAEAGDAPETISQILSQALFDLKPPIDLLPALRGQRERCLKAHGDVVRDWEQGRDVSKYTGSAENFIGSYIGLNSCRISIAASDTAEAKVAIVFNNDQASKCDLEPYNADALSFFVLEHDKLLAKSMLDWDYYKVGVIEFVKDSGVVVGFWWQWDGGDYPALWVRTGNGVGEEQVRIVSKKFGRFLNPNI